jgi:hypothetical protein
MSTETPLKVKGSLITDEQYDFVVENGPPTSPLKEPFLRLLQEG